MSFIGCRRVVMTQRSETVPAERAAILFDGVSKRFTRADGSELLAIENVSFALPAGRIVALLGPSGSGKTTLLNMAAGLIEPDAGELRIAGRNRAETDWSRVGYMFQDDRLLPWRNAVGNIALALEAEPSLAAERRARSLVMLDLMGLREFSDTYPHELSGGMRSRIALARSLVTEADILLMDEPFARLDVQTRVNMHAQVLKLQASRNLSVLFVTHDADEAVALADDVVVLSPRPGRVRRSVKISLPRPRSANPEAFLLAAELRAQIGDEISSAYADA
jgi:ABC-type nitrate/sulfonate/bicarbonate transport system ATPase subunit